MIDWSTVASLTATFVGGGVITSLFTLRQKRDGANIDNASRLVKEYTDLLAKYKSDFAEQEQRIATLNKRITDLEAQYSEKVHAIEKDYEEKIAAIREDYEARIADLEQKIANQNTQLASLKRAVSQDAVPAKTPKRTPKKKDA